MAYSDQVILRTLRQLLADYGPNATLSYQALADASGASRTTVKRAVLRLITTGAIQLVSRHNNGYQYRICDGDVTGSPNR